LQDYADALCEDDYCEANWERIENYVADGKIAINAANTKPAVATARDEAKKNIGAVPREEKVGNFALTITVDEDTLTYDELYDRHFWVYAELKNQTGEDIEIIVDVLFWLDLQNWQPNEESREMPMPETILFLRDSSIKREPVLQAGILHEAMRFGVGAHGDDEEKNLPIGIHELRFVARFIFEGKAVEILSNTILLTVQ